eukprot:scaffold8954_cov194-Skeletonema_marinoi.AAC.1
MSKAEKLEKIIEGRVKFETKERAGDQPTQKKRGRRTLPCRNSHSMQGRRLVRRLQPKWEGSKKEVSWTGAVVMLRSVAEKTCVESSNILVLEDRPKIVIVIILEAKPLLCFRFAASSQSISRACFVRLKSVVPPFRGLPADRDP